MNIDIDPLSETPIYQQIRDRIVEAIARGELHRGNAIASVRALAGQFGINPATVSKAYDLLRAEGFLGANAKSGTFVIADPQTPTTNEKFENDWHARLFTLLAEGHAHGLSGQDLRHYADAVIQTLTGGVHEEVMA